WAQRLAQHASVRDERHAEIVARHRQPDLGHVEDSLCRSPVVERVVEHPAVRAVARDDFVVPVVGVEGERKLTAKTVAVENQGLARQTNRLLELERNEELVQKI